MRIKILATVLTLMMLFSTAMTFAAADPAVTIVSPSQTVYGDNLFVSIKMTAQKTIRVSAFEEKQKVGDTLVSIDPAAEGEQIDEQSIVSVSIMTAETFKGTSNLQFYNKKISEIKPGLYRVKVETLDSAGAVTASSSNRIFVMPAGSETTSGSVIFETQQTGAFQWVQNLIKTIFGN